MNWTLAVVAAVIGAAATISTLAVLFVAGLIGSLNKKLLAAENDNVALRSQVKKLTIDCADVTRRPFIINFSEQQVFKLAHLIAESTQTLYDSANKPAN